MNRYLLMMAVVVGLTVLGGGCGGEDRTAAPRVQSPPDTPAAPVHRPTRRVLVAALGDSITAGSPLWDPDAAVRDRAPDQVNDQSQYEYWARRRLGPLARFRNCGVNGETTAEIARRLDRCARGAGVLIVQGGINDVYRPVTVEATAANLREMLRRGKALGLRVALTDVLPWNNGYPRFAAKIDRLNRLIVDVARQERVPLLPFHRTLEDPQNPQRMRADWTIDGDHPNVIGYRRLGEIVELP
ncbi:MAG: GDSL-type esterase/lipase family protein [Actinomycetota bacterium]|nr:GDSL-type esterase/lipase family protein [Actinomycetota bacterium]